MEWGPTWEPWAKGTTWSPPGGGRKKNRNWKGHQRTQEMGTVLQCATNFGQIRPGQPPPEEPVTRLAPPISKMKHMTQPRARKSPHCGRRYGAMKGASFYAEQQIHQLEDHIQAIMQGQVMRLMARFHQWRHREKL